MKTTTMNTTETNKPTFVKRPAAARGQTELGWLHSRHTFSFGGYFDPDHMGYRSLRVINDDVVEAGQGFGEHPHRDAEIFSYVIDGELEHKDSMGNGSVIKAGDLQYISQGRASTKFRAGSAIRVKENKSDWLRVVAANSRSADFMESENPMETPAIQAEWEGNTIPAVLLDPLFKWLDYLIAEHGHHLYMAPGIRIELSGNV